MKTIVHTHTIYKDVYQNKPNMPFLSRNLEDPQNSQPRDISGKSAAPSTPALTMSLGAEKSLSSIPLHIQHSHTGLSSELGLCIKRTIVVSVIVFIVAMIVIFLRIFRVIDLFGPSFPDLN